MRTPSQRWLHNKQMRILARRSLNAALRRQSRLSELTYVRPDGYRCGICGAPAVHDPHCDEGAVLVCSCNGRSQSY